MVHDMENPGAVEAHGVSDTDHAGELIGSETNGATKPVQAVDVAANLARAFSVASYTKRSRRTKAQITSIKDAGRVAEVFIGNHKTGSHAETAARDSAVVASIALQHGVDLDTLRKALLRDARGRPSGPLGIVLDRLSEAS